MASEDNELIHKAKLGDMTAFEQLVFRHDKRVLSIAARYCTSADEAKDIYQEVFLRVYRGLRRFRFRSEFSTWLYRITTNVCLTHKSRRRKNTHTSLDETRGNDDDETHFADTHQSLPDQQAIDGEISRHIYDAVESLPPRQKMVFTLKHYEGYKLREIASMMSCTEGTVKRYLFLATQQMRGKLSRFCD